MILIADTDAIIKLCAYGLWDEAVACLGVAPSSVLTLVQARFMFARYARTPRKTDRYTEPGIQRAMAVAHAASAVAVPLDLGEQDALVAAGARLSPDKPPLDPGEVLLFLQGAALDEAFYLTTGDKSALAALASVPEAERVRKALRGRVLCLEQLLLRLTDDIGVGEVSARVRRVPACDTAITNVFGRSAAAPQDAVFDGLASEIDALRRDTAELLAQDL